MKAPTGSSHPDPPESQDGPDDRPVFHHPPWMVGVVLLFGFFFILAAFENPVWLLIGAPCILALVVYVVVRLIA